MNRLPLSAKAPIFSFGESPGPSGYRDWVARVLVPCEHCFQIFMFKWRMNVGSQVFPIMSDVWLICCVLN